MKRTLREKLKNKQYREQFVASHIDMGVPFQIRALREQRELSQQAFGEMLTPPTTQEGVSRIENPNYGLKLDTLKRIAAALDVALIVRFVPFSELVSWVNGLSESRLAVPSFGPDRGLDEPSVNGTADRVRVHEELVSSAIRVRRSDAPPPAWSDSRRNVGDVVRMVGGST